MLRAGLSLAGRTSFFVIRTEKGAQPGTLKRPQANSFVKQQTFHCSCGPEDFSSLAPEALTQQHVHDSSRVSAKARGNSRKRGCLFQFKATTLYCWPEIVQLSPRHAEHTNAAGSPAHGQNITEQGVRYQHAPALSQDIKDWVRTKLLAGVPTRQILKEHYKSSLPKITADSGDRDCFLTSQDIRNVANKLAELTWKLHSNEAQSVRMFYEQHVSIVFIYEEQVNGQSASDSQSAVQAQKFVIGIVTEKMLANLLRYGNGNIILLDATFGTNHMKMPLYTGIVIDEWGNGMPVFMILCQGTTQNDLRKWLAALLQRIREHNPSWMCSCIMVDDALAEINAIRSATYECTVHLHSGMPGTMSGITYQ